MDATPAYLVRLQLKEGVADALPIGPKGARELLHSLGVEFSAQ